MKTYDPWAEQSLLDTAIEKGAVYTHEKTGWKFKVRHMTPWSPYIGRATALVYARKDVIEANRKRQAGTVLTEAEIRLLDDAELEIQVRGTIIGWSKNVFGPDRKPLEITTANGMLLARKLPQVWREIQMFSVTPANFGITGETSATEPPPGADPEGNSSGTSDTDSEASADS